MSFVERIQLPFQSFFDIIIDSIGGKKVVISPRLNVFYVATSDDDAISYALNLSNQLNNAGIYHIVLAKTSLSTTQPSYTYNFPSTALLIGNWPWPTVNAYIIFSGSRIVLVTSIFTPAEFFSINFTGGPYPNVNNAVINNYLKGNNVAVAAGATSLAVTLPTTLQNTNYAVYVTPQWNTSVWITGKTTTGFTINFGTAAPTGGSALDWVVFF